MSQWFVYSNATYYPDAAIVEADDLAGLYAALAAEGYPSVREGLAIFPLDAIAEWRGQGGESITEALTVLP
jgi:hypothetical protein